MSLRLDPVDTAFVESIIEEVTASNALPFNIPISRIPNLVKKAAKYFYEWSDNATQQYWLAIPCSEISRVRSGSLNAPIKLPKYVKAIFQLYTTNMGLSGFTGNAFSRSLAYEMYSNNFRSFGSSSEDGYGQDHASLAATTVGLFELSNYRSLLQKGVRFDFNENTSIINVQGNTNGASLVLDCACAIDKESLYQDYYFFEYCVALVNEQLGKIISAYDFKFPGGVTISAQAKEDGKERRLEIEQHLKDTQSNDMIFTS